RINIRNKIIFLEGRGIKIFMCSNKFIVIWLTAMMMSLQGAAQVGSSQAPLILPHYGEGERDIVAFYATTTLDDGEVVPWFPIEEVVVRAERQWKSPEERAQYLRLKRMYCGYCRTLSMHRNVMKNWIEIWHWPNLPEKSAD